MWPVIWRRPELRVLLVCTANVCRSPLAEGMLRRRVRAAGLAGRVRVQSAGTRTGRQGRRPDPRIVKLAADAGFSLGGIRTRKLTLNMLHQSDYVLVMEYRHLDDVARLIGAEADSDRNESDSTAVPEKVKLLGSFLPLQGKETVEIPDPYFGDRQGLLDVYQLLDFALEEFLVCLELRLGICRES